MADTMTGLKRTNYCGETTSALTGQEVVVCGWVQKIGRASCRERVYVLV